MIQIMTITPDMARHWLEGNTINRTVRAAMVEKYARDMAAGSWSIGDSAISIDKDGVLLNGQHRLLACIKADVPFTAIVNDDCDRDIVFGMDRGRSRTFEDNASFVYRDSGNYHLYTNRYCSAVARMLIAQKLGVVAGGKYAASDKEIAEMIDEHAAAMACMSSYPNMMHTKSADGAKAIRNAGTLTAIVKAYDSGVTEEMLDAFADCVVFGCKTDRSRDLTTDNRLMIASLYRSTHARIKGRKRASIAIEGYAQNAIWHFAADDVVKQLKPNTVYCLKEV